MNTENYIEAVADAAHLTVPERAEIALCTPERESKLRGLLANSARIVALTNKAGREECHSAYMVLKNARCSIVNLAADATEDAKQFTKAVAAEAKRLIGITQAEEDRLMALRDAYDEQVEAEKQAKIKAERERVERITADIQKIRNMVLSVAGNNSVLINAAIEILEEMDATEARFEEYVPSAKAAMTEAIDQLVPMLSEAKQREQDARDAEAARIAEAQRVADERAELARLQAEAAARAKAEREELDRMRAIHAEEQRKLYERAAQIEADRKAREAEAQRLAEQTARNLQAERDAIAEQARIEREAQEQKIAAAAADIDARRAKFEADMLAHEAKVEADQKARDAAARIEADHAEALAMNAQNDAEAANRAMMEWELQPAPVRAQACSTCDGVGLVGDPPNDFGVCQDCNLIGTNVERPAPVRTLAELADDMVDGELWPTDEEIVTEIMAMFAMHWSMDGDQANARMSRFDWDMAVAMGEVVA